MGRRKASSWTHRYEAQQGVSSDVGEALEDAVRAGGGRSPGIDGGADLNTGAAGTVSNG